MNATDLRLKASGELTDSLFGLLKHQFELRMQLGAGQLTKHHQIRINRKDIARIKTVMSEKKRIGSAE